MKSKSGDSKTLEARATLLSFNTVERLLRGDFFHTVSWETVAHELGRFPADWSLAGVGTTNWFGRNGEAIIHGTVGAPLVHWSDPRKSDPMHVIDLLTERPSSDGRDLISPALDEEGEKPAFPFFALGVCDPSTEIVWEVPADADLHGWLVERFHEENLGMAAIALEGPAKRVEYSSAFYLPLGGVEMGDLYHADANFRMAGHDGGRWIGSGVFAANPTLQRIISVEGLPLHLHGFEEALRMGGHLSRLTAADGMRVRVRVLKDFLLEIRNLDLEHVETREVQRRE